MDGRGRMDGHGRGSRNSSAALLGAGLGTPPLPAAAPTIAIVGAGFSGTLLALHALRRCPAATRILLIERRFRFGHGQAYATSNASHLLNVPAGKMSAFQDKPADFLDWLRARERQADPAQAPTASCFVPRRTYGAYMRHLLKQELRRPDTAGRLLLVRDDVVGLDEAGSRLLLRFARHEERAADVVVLATGSLPPATPPHVDTAGLDSSTYSADPWAADALADLPRQAPVLLIGTGLTMVDLVTSLLDQGHAGPIHAMSRRGLLPERHAPAGSVGDAAATAYPTSPGALLRVLRAQARRTAELGGDWRSVVDALRPLTHDVWQAMSRDERARFMRHGRRWWDVHRHRMAPAVAERIASAQASGQLRIGAGRLRSLRLDAGQVTASFDMSGGGEACVQAARVINCAGPGADYRRITQPLLRALLSTGIVRPDPLHLGLDVTGSCALLSRDGAISRRIFAVGPPTRGRFWEMTAVPDIRRQCELLAATLAALIKP